MKLTILARVAGVLILMAGPDAGAQAAPARQDSVSVRIVNVDLRAAVQLLSQYVDRPVLFSGPVGPPVTLEASTPVARADVLALLRSLVVSQGYEFVEDSAAHLFRVHPAGAARAAAGATPAVPPRPPGAISLHVIMLQHARATDVASTINALYGRGGGSSNSAPVGTLGDDLRGNLVPPQGAGAAPPISPPPRPANLSGEITVVADGRANSLLVRANTADIELIREVVQALDVRPMQVLIEVLVAEIRRDKSIGVNVQGELGPTTASNGLTLDGGLGGAGLGDFALRVMGIGKLDLDATLRLASARGNVRILTRPVVLATNNQEAEIVVGSQRPFVQVQRALPTDNASRDQVIQYKDVGTKLTVRPTISSDGSVQLEVTQEVSTATSELAFDAPVISTRSVQTQLLVQDNQTVALGGLTDRQQESRQQGFPILSSIPLLGGLFGGAKRQTVETELFIFLTPRVIRTAEDAERLATPLKERAGVEKPD